MNTCSHIRASLFGSEPNRARMVLQNDERKDRSVRETDKQEMTASFLAQSSRLALPEHRWWAVRHSKVRLSGDGYKRCRYGPGCSPPGTALHTHHPLVAPGLLPFRTDDAGRLTPEEASARAASLMRGLVAGRGRLSLSHPSNCPRNQDQLSSHAFVCGALKPIWA